ncbi:MAG TPA: hypothetical protein VGQ26_22565 [Streptosporangiaceae bacterium]|nr:hypothetical protein [Streptosporangiaceae bacterium]
MPNPASYTPRHISEQILAVRGAIEGERKQVSVLFCDIVASSALAAELGPEEFHLVIDRFFRVALAEVQRYEGTIQPGHWSTARSMPGTQARPPKPQVCSAARYARRATLGTCEGTRHEGVGNDDWPDRHLAPDRPAPFGAG